MESRYLVVKHGLSEEERVLTLETFQEFVCESQSDIYLPRQTITPSEASGHCTFAEERNKRYCAVALIQKAAALLTLPAQVVATAATLFHRFYYRHSFHKFP